ncbi:MAG: hypothetical protein ACTHK7_16235 [Aureliella sp.]
MSPESVLRSRRDIAWQRLQSQSGSGSAGWSAFDPIARTCYRCGPTERWLFEQFDGKRSLRTIASDCQRDASQPPISLAELQAMAELLIARGLARPVDAAGRLPHAQPRPGVLTRWLKSLSNSVSWRVRGVNPEHLLRWLAPHTDCFFSASAVRVWLTLTTLIGLLVLADFSRLVDQAQLWQWLMRPASGTSLFIVFLLTRALHELGHALVLTRHGGRCPDIGVIFMLGTPCVYCDVTESWRLPSRLQRAAVAAGGMYAELIIATLAAIVWLATDYGPVNTLALQTMVVCSISTLLINANPLMRFDGYYILSDALDEPNLRVRADASLLAIVHRGLLGARAPRSENRTLSPWRRGALAAYALASLAYRLSLSLMMATVLIALYSAWQLAWIGRILAVILLFGWWVIPAMKLSQNLMRTAGNWRVRVRLAALAAAVVLVVCAVPLPCRQHAVGWIQPERTQGLYAPAAARLHRVLKKPGELVQPGEVVFELDDEQPRLRAIEAAGSAEKARLQLVSVRRQRYFAQPPTIDLTALETAAQAAQRQAEHARSAVEELSVRSTLSGRLMSLPAAALLDIDNRPIEHETQLWLRAEQLGRYVPTGTMLGAVCSQEQIAVLPVDAEQLQGISAGTPVRVHIPAAGSAVVPCRVAAVVRLDQLDSVARLIAEASEREHGTAGQSQSVGGSLAQSPVQSRASTTAGYAAIVPLPASAFDGRTAFVNAQVQAAFVVPPKTLAARGADWARANLRWLLP